MNEKKLLTWLKYLLHAVILGGVVIAAVRYLNGAEVLAAFERFDDRYARCCLRCTWRSRGGVLLS